MITEQINRYPGQGLRVADPVGSDNDGVGAPLIWGDSSGWVR